MPGWVTVDGGRRVELGDQIGSGAEGVVLAVRDRADLYVKVMYAPSDDLAARIRAMVPLPPGQWHGDHADHLHVAWPMALASDGSGEPRGYFLPRIEGRDLESLFDPVSRLQSLDHPTWGTMLSIAARAARLFDRMHRAGFVLGDVSPNNLLVTRSAHVSLIDCAGLQFHDPVTDRVWGSTKVTPEYAPPDYRQGETLAPEHDLFGMAVVIARLVMEGGHPYEGVPADGSDRLPDQNIAVGNNRIVRPERLRPLLGELPVECLPPRLLALFRQVFGPGERDPGRRPSPAAWVDVLDRAVYELRGCLVNDRHLYHPSAGGCIWCRRAGQGLGDSYPPSIRSDPVVPSWAPPPSFPSTPSSVAAPQTDPVSRPVAAVVPHHSDAHPDPLDVDPFDVDPFDATPVHPGVLETDPVHVAVDHPAPAAGDSSGAAGVLGGLLVLVVVVLLIMALL